MHPPHFMEPQSSSLFSSEPTTCPIPSRLNPVPIKPQYSLQTHFTKDLYAQVITFFQVFAIKSLNIFPFRYSYQNPWIYFISLENLPHALPISFFWLLLSTILCIRQFRGRCVSFGGAWGWKFISGYLTFYWVMSPWRQTYANLGHLATSDSQLMNKVIVHTSNIVIKEFQRSPTFNFTI